MPRFHDTDTDPGGTGISRPLSENVNLLGDLLGRVISDRAGDAMLQRVEELRLLCKDAAASNDEAPRRRAASLIHQLSNDDIGWLLRAYGTFFHLVNQAEKAEILRINRERSAASSFGTPVAHGTGTSGDASQPAFAAVRARRVRPESIDEAIGRLAADGRSLDDVMAIIGRLDLQPTLTAHPTEARRQSVLYKQKRIAELLADLRRPDATADEMDHAVAVLHSQIALLMGTDEIRSERPTVDDEVEHGLYFMQGAIWETAPRIHHDVVRALQLHFRASPEVPMFLHWRSWIGSDRDGNPNVTPAVTRRTVLRQRRLAIALHRSELVELHRELSLSDRQVDVPAVLLDALAAEDSEGDEQPATGPSAHEPYRRMIERMIARLDAMADGDADAESAAAYPASRFVADLDVLRDSLEQSGLHEVARAGRLPRTAVLARTFGFHLASLDVRQHSRLHEQALTELLRMAGVTDDYGALTEEAKLVLLERELRNPRPLVPTGARLGAGTQSMIETFGVMREAIDRDANAIGSYIISMTHTVSDLLEPMLLAREAGLWRYRDGSVESPIDFVPLFETIDDLRLAGHRLTAMFDQPIYRLQLQARGDFQEIMLGYSDSNKDGGYWMANWALHCAQSDIGLACRTAHIDFRMFHGRGGTVGRGGGRANQAIGAMPGSAQNGRIRVTEQGEVISFRYALPELAHRHTEQLVSAMLISTDTSGREYAVSERGAARDESLAASSPSDGDATLADVGPDAVPDAYTAALMDRIAQASMRAYRALIDSGEFWEWYLHATPIEQIGGLPIASRPVSRGSAADVEFEDLRAIPWVFAWTQTRAIVPGWFGIGTALEEVLKDDTAVTRLQTLYHEWPFLRAVIANAQREMARARLPIAREYARLAMDDGGAGGVFATIAADYESAEAAILRITGQAALLDDSPVIRKSIALRNPYTDVLNLVQIELLDRSRNAGHKDDQLRRLLFLSINGLAGAMQSTG